jgi:hypothetical protein
MRKRAIIGVIGLAICAVPLITTLALIVEIVGLYSHGEVFISLYDSTLEFYSYSSDRGFYIDAWLFIMFILGFILFFVILLFLILELRHGSKEKMRTTQSYVT